MIAIAYKYFYCRDMKKCKELFKNRFGTEASIKDCEVIRRVCVAVSTRAARLAAAGIVALVKKIDKTGGCTVAVDGTLYKRALFSDRYYTIQIDFVCNAITTSTSFIAFLCGDNYAPMMELVDYNTFELFLTYV